MAGITWLHLSDWHQRGQELDRQLVRDELILDIRHRAHIDKRLSNVDFIAFAGDLTFNGKPDEYKSAKNELIEPLLEVAGLKPKSGRNAERLFIVPGNHDLSLDIAYEMLPPELLKPFESDVQVQKWLSDIKRRQRVLEPFDSFREFVTSYIGQSTPDYASVRRWNIGDKKVALVGLNSALMCARRDEPNDYWRVIIGEAQVRDALAKIMDADLRIAVMHHPFDWIAPFDRNRIEALLGQEFHFILHGHEHNPLIHIEYNRDCVIIPAGASYNRHFTDDSHIANAYNFVHLDFDTGKGTIYLRRWSDLKNKWEEDTDSYPSGRFLLAPLPKNLAADALSTSSSSDSFQSLDIYSDHRQQSVLQRYCEIILNSYGAIDLPGLPELNLHMANQGYRLHDFCIPLHVNVDASPTNETAKPNLEGKLRETLQEFDAAPPYTKEYKERGADQCNRVPVGKQLSLAKHLVIIGQPGSGKTTLIRSLATAYILRLKRDDRWKELSSDWTLPDEDWLPIVVRCRDLDLHDLTTSLVDVVIHYLRRVEFSQAEAFDFYTLLKKRLENGQALLLLDGLDEITDPSSRGNFFNKIEEFVLNYPRAPILATSRIMYCQDLIYGLNRCFKYLTLSDLTHKEKDDFVRCWVALTELPALREDTIQNLIHTIHISEQIEQLTDNPLLLTTLLLIRRYIGRLPHRRAGLYREALQVVMNWGIANNEPWDWEEVIPHLEYLAYAMCDWGVQQVRHDEVLQLFTRKREEYPNMHPVRKHKPKEILKRLQANTGILIEVSHTYQSGITTPLYEFRHRCFQEYLAALALVDGRFPGRNRRQNLAAHVASLVGRTIEISFTESGISEIALVGNWSEALRLCVTICNYDDVDEVLLAILTPLEGEPPSTARARAILAAHCLSDEPNVSNHIAQKVVNAFVTQIAKDDLSAPCKGLKMLSKELAGTRWSSVFRSALLGEQL